MERNSQLEALVLNVRQFGEQNRIVTFLSLEKGVFEAVLFGGPKSRLRSLVSPGHFGKLWIYADQQKNSIKITDFEVTKFHTELRESLYKNWCASFASELVIKTDSSGEKCPENERTWKLVNGFLDGICASSEDECRIAVLRFIWRYLDVLGMQYDCKRCVLCDEGLDESAVFSLSEGGFLCHECAGIDSKANETNLSFQDKPGMFFLSQESVAFLQGVTYLSPKQAREMPLHMSSTRQLHDLLFFLIAHATENRLKTLELEKALLR